MPKYTLYQRMFDDEWEAKFSFEAKDEADALSKAKGWARYHSFSQRDVKVKPSTPHEVQYWLHNEYVS